MKIILPSLLIIGLAGGLVQAQTGGNSTDPRFELPVDPATASLSSADRTASGGDLLAQRVAAALAQHKSISARVRYRVDLVGHQLVGEGIYLQLGSGEGQQIRLELKTVVGERLAVFQQVCDGRFLWQYQDSAEKPAAEAAQKPQVTRVDIHRVRQALANHAPGQRQLLPASTELAFGGLPKLVDGLKQSFTFSRVEADQLGSLPIWIATGNWRPEVLTPVSKELADEASTGQPLDLRKLPAQMPEVVRFCVGQDDLFPYRIEYLRRASKLGRAGEGGVLQPIVTVEFYEVRLNSPISPTNFVYQPGNADALDTTQSFMKSLGLKQ